MSELIHPARGCDTDIMCLLLCFFIFFQQVIFLTVNHCGPPPPTPLEGTSLHRRNNSVERPWGDLEPVYNLCPITNELIHPTRGCDTDLICVVLFSQQVIFLTVNHCRPIPLRKLHSTDEAIVWRDPGGS